MGEWINKLLHIHPMKDHSAIKRNELLDIYNNKDDSQRYYASERSQSQKIIYINGPSVTFWKQLD